MFRSTLMAVATAAALAVPGLALAQQAQVGTAAEARAMLDKAAAAIRADKAKALEAFNAGTGGFKDRDLYPFCANATDGMFTAHPTQKGQSMRAMKDSTGTSRKTEMYADAGVWFHAFGKFRATMPKGTATRIWPTTLRQPLSPRLRWRRTFM